MPSKKLNKILNSLQTIEDGILVIAFGVMVVSFFLQVVNRNIFKLSMSWFEELATFCMIYMAFLAAEAGLRDGTQISVTALTDKLTGKPKIFVQLVAKAIVITFSAIIFYTSIDMLRMQLISQQASPALGIPMVIPYFAITLSFAIITVIQSAVFAVMLKEFFNKGPNSEEAA
ncbi:TRAP transporter small permease [Cloacibacillus evryensis]|uniref:TRAP transporter small permease n=1 Tax=Cloacibacillus evryensis TaxID=508460 RepID=A0AAW5K4R3_9BACT|nr:TRAP transporter small permease [Cloacibacillus evryensis]EHL70446.1 hypothetical protein HMPREF1006_02397 [Synergistes sp. 3_1_syn1]EXG78310.1 TRAP-type C4-dicarboxylate transport system, small permease component [Cloacibacillus evryensis DSM 19522]MCQ4814144.1 TRAP transporter small permease [Cloacibacillus evryensis]MEA5036300.1 TRAP transporter small permease [Cloacibacillus evryensis]